MRPLRHRNLIAIALCGLLTGCYAASWNPQKLDAWSDREISPELAAQLPDLRERDEIRILVFGDSGKPETFRDVAKWMGKACADRCDFGLVLGDNFYLRGPSETDPDEFQTHFKQPLLDAHEEFRDRAFWVVPGNHAYVSLFGRPDSDPAVQLEYTHSQSPGDGPYWLMPALQFSVPLLPDWLTIVGFDSFLASDRRSFRGSDAEFLAYQSRYISRVYRELSAKQSLGWRVLFGHHPNVTIGGHHEGNRMRGVREPFAQSLPLIYFSGHDHDQQLIEAGGLIQVIQGSASKSRDGVWGVNKAEEYFQQALVPGYKKLRQEISAEYCEKLGFAIAEFRPDRFSLTFFWGHEGDGAILGSRTWRWTRSAKGEVLREDPPAAGTFVNLCP